MQRWYDTSRGVSIQTVTGRPGIGKTRLATEFIAQISDRHPDAHDAHFAGPTDWSSVTYSSGAGGWLWSNPTLLVVDHAALEAQRLRQLLDHAARQAPKAVAPLRILLLERHGSPDRGWLRYVQEKSPALFERLPPLELRGLPSDIARQGLLRSLRQVVANANLVPAEMANRVDEETADENGSCATAVLDLARILMMEVLTVGGGLGQQSSTKPARTALAWQLADLESNRLAQHAPPGAAYGGQWMLHLAACATALGGVSSEDLISIAEDEQRALRWPSPGAKVLAESLQSALPPGEGQGIRIADELVGEAIVLRAFGHRTIGLAGRKVLRRLALTEREFLRSFLARLAIDFSEWTTPEPLEWLGAVLEDPKIPPVGWLLEVEQALPAGVPGLRALTLRLSEQVLGAMRSHLEDADSKALFAESARLMGQLSWRLADLGRPDAGVDAAQQAERIICRIAAEQPLPYRRDWVDALEVLAIRLSELGQTEAATEKARLAEANCAATAASVGDQRNGPFRPGRHGFPTDSHPSHEGRGQPVNGPYECEASSPRDPTSDQARWADSLLVCAAVLAHSGQNLEARMKAAQAVELYRRLANEQPEAFLPKLVVSQSRFAVLVAACGEPQEADRMIREAGFTCRLCHPPCPTWALAEWARGLGMIAESRRHSESRQASLALAEQAAETWRKLALQHPGAFMPDLGRALSELAARLEECDRARAALACWAEAEEVYRSLAEIEPGTFLADVALTLLNSAMGLCRGSDWETALLKAKQAQTLFESLAQDKPAEFLVYWARALSVEATCYRSLPRRAHEIENYGRGVICWWLKLHSHSTVAGTFPDAEVKHAGSNSAAVRPVAG